MSDNIKMEDLIEKEVDPTSEPTKEVEPVVETEVETTDEAEQDVLKTELERVNKTGKTEKEKAEYSLKKNAERVKALGGDPTSILGIKQTTFDDDEDQPLTVGMYKKIQQESATKTALQLAEEVQNETERELTKFHLANSIKSTGNPNEDFKLARTLVNAVKNSKIIEESARKSQPKAHSSASSAPAKDTEINGDLTDSEKVFLGKPFNMSKESILKLRK